MEGVSCLDTTEPRSALRFGAHELEPRAGVRPRVPQVSGGLGISEPPSQPQGPHGTPGLGLAGWTSLCAMTCLGLRGWGAPGPAGGGPWRRDPRFRAGAQAT